MTSPTSAGQRISHLDLSIEALWMARVIQDALEVTLACHSKMGELDVHRLKELRIHRDVFERLGIYGCSAERVSPWSAAWSAPARVELVRQVGVYWRALIDASFGTAVTADLIKSLTPREVELIDQIQQLGRALQHDSRAIDHYMQQELDAMARRQIMLRHRRCAAYLNVVQDKPAL